MAIFSWLFRTVPFLTLAFFIFIIYFWICLCPNLSSQMVLYLATLKKGCCEVRGCWGRRFVARTSFTSIICFHNKFSAWRSAVKLWYLMSHCTESGAPGGGGTGQYHKMSHGRVREPKNYHVLFEWMDPKSHSCPPLRTPMIVPRFRLTNRDDYFRVDFDNFWMEHCRLVS